MIKIINNSIYIEHLTGPGHPESPERYKHIINNFKKLGWLDTMSHPARKATFEDLLLCHTEAYIQVVQDNILECVRSGRVDGTFMLSTGDVLIGPKSLEAALWAVGGILNAVDVVMEGKAESAFCVVRPPGHHACSSQGMGFCIFNNVAIGARYVQQKYGLSRVLIVDWDVHHGNGTEEIFAEDPSVFYFSTHQKNLYPGTGAADFHGAGKGLGTILNFPIVGGLGSRLQVLKAFENDLVEAMKSFKPEFIFISAGFDAHKKDPLGGFDLEDEDFAKLTTIVKEIALIYSKGRIVSALEGGYNLKALATSTEAHLKALI